MNITDYLVDYLKQGKPVSVPSLGTMVAKEIEAFFDSSSATFYPTHTSIQIEPENSSNTLFVDYIAKKECVGTSTAEKIWKNYCDALKDKLQSEGRCQLASLGTIVSNNGSFSFEMSEKSSLNPSAQCLQPINGIRTYTDSVADDPFLMFEQPIRDGEVTSSTLHNSKPSPAPIPTPSPTPEPKPTPKPIPEPTPEPQPQPTPEPITEPTPTPTPEQTQEPTPEPEPEPEPTPAPKPTPEPTPTPTPEPITEQAPEPSAFNDSDTLKQLDAIEKSKGGDEPFISNNGKKKKKEKKKGGFWKAILWILATIIILLACAFVIDHYLLNSKGCQWVMQQVGYNSNSVKAVSEIPDDFPTAPADYDKDEAHDNITQNTLSLEGLQYSTDEIDAQSDNIISYLTPFLLNQLKEMGFSGSKELFLSKAREFANNRLNELLVDDSYHPEVLFNYDDYVRESLMSYLKDVKMRRRSSAIQAELMHRSTIEQIISQIAPDEVLPTTTEEAEPVQRQAAPAQNKKAEAKPAATHSQFLSSSKQGYDVIAGYTVKKENADRLCSSLKSKGCDAYVIEINQGYYISMGSASSNTAIEATFNHIKEWYQGNIYIKKW